MPPQKRCGPADAACLRRVPHGPALHHAADEELLGGARLERVLEHRPRGGAEGPAAVGAEIPLRPVPRMAMPARPRMAVRTAAGFRRRPIGGRRRGGGRVRLSARRGQRLRQECLFVILRK